MRSLALAALPFILALGIAPTTAREPGDRSSVTRKFDRAAHVRKAHRAPRARNDKGEFPLLAPIKALVKLIATPSQPEKVHVPRRSIHRRCGRWPLPYGSAGRPCHIVPAQTALRPD